MKSYSAKIRLHGSRDNEVMKTELSPAELLVLTHIHGDEGIVDVREVDKVLRRQKDPAGERLFRWTSDQERKYLIRTYGEKNFKAIFPGPLDPLPEEFVGPLAGVDVIPDEELPVEEELMPVIPGITKGKKAQPAAVLA